MNNIGKLTYLVWQISMMQFKRSKRRQIPAAGQSMLLEYICNFDDWVFEAKSNSNILSRLIPYLFTIIPLTNFCLLCLSVEIPIHFHGQSTSYCLTMR